MSSTKRFTGNYNITSIGTQGNVNLSAKAINITGNLNVFGTATYTEYGNSAVQNNFITLNEGLPSTVVPTFDAGIIINRGTSANVELRWHEITRSWQITNDGINYSNIAALTSGGGILVLDTNPTLSANLNTASNTIFSTSSLGVVQFASNIAIAQTTVAPLTLAANTVVYAQNVGPGNTGLYVTAPNQTRTNQELITKNKALAFSLFM